jgi:hypothetical protein
MKGQRGLSGVGSRPKWKRENEILRQERDILKKAMQVFAKDGH